VLIAKRWRRGRSGAALESASQNPYATYAARLPAHHGDRIGWSIDDIADAIM
jgi:hypothetical protein